QRLPPAEPARYFSPHMPFPNFSPLADFKTLQVLSQARLNSRIIFGRLRVDHVSVLSEARIRDGVRAVTTMLWCAFDKTVSTKPLAFAVDVVYGNSIDLGLEVIAPPSGTGKNRHLTLEYGLGCMIFLCRRLLEINGAQSRLAKQRSEPV